MTGLESATIIRAVARETKANLVIVVDTLATAKPMRVFRSFQLTDAGLEPGSATQAGRDKINFAWVYPSLQSASRRAFTQGKSCSIHLKNQAD